MSPTKPVTSLQNQCLQIIYKELAYAVVEENIKTFKIINRCLAPAILERLLKRMLKLKKLDPSIRFSCIQLLLTNGANEIETGMFPRFYYDKILKVTAEDGYRLQHLNLRGVWAADFPSLLSQLIRSLKGLKSLIIPNMANDEVIEAVGTLENLILLDISGEAYFTATGIRCLSSSSLEILDIGKIGIGFICPEEELEEPELDEEEDSEEETLIEGTELDELEEAEIEISSFQLLADIIKNLPNLKAVRTYSYTGCAITLLRNQYPKYRTKLMCLCDTETSIPLMENILAVCPELENLNLYCPDNGVIEKVEKLHNLNTLKLSKPNLQEFLNFLTISGQRLQVLKLSECKNTVLDLSQLSLFAPNLHTIEFLEMKVRVSNSESYLNNLNNIQLSCCNISKDAIRLIFANSPNLKAIIVTGSFVNLKDSDILKLCADGKLINLEKLWFSSAKLLTAGTVEVLLQHCPKLIQIGKLDGWAVNVDEFLDLRDSIRCRNIDLCIFPR